MSEGKWIPTIQKIIKKCPKSFHKLRSPIGTIKGCWVIMADCEFTNQNNGYKWIEPKRRFFFESEKEAMKFLSTTNEPVTGPPSLLKEVKK